MQTSEHSKPMINCQAMWSTYKAKIPQDKIYKVNQKKCDRPAQLCVVLPKPHIKNDHRVTIGWEGNDGRAVIRGSHIQLLSVCKVQSHYIRIISWCWWVTAVYRGNGVAGDLGFRSHWQCSVILCSGECKFYEINLVWWILCILTI